MIIDQVQQALVAMTAAGDKTEANRFLEQFQKSAEAWDVTRAILSAPGHSMELQYFAAQTLRSKVALDLEQVPREARVTVKDTVTGLLARYAQDARGKIVRTQLCVTLANLAVRLEGWADPTREVVEWFEGQAAGAEAAPAAALRTTLLEFLRVLPEEMTDPRARLTDAQFHERAQTLLTGKAPAVLALLAQYADDAARTNDAGAMSATLECLALWCLEVDVEAVLAHGALMEHVMTAAAAAGSGGGSAVQEAALAALSALLHASADLPFAPLEPLHRALVALPDTEELSRTFIEAAEAWTPLVAQHPEHFGALVGKVLRACGADRDLETVRHTFGFWYQLKQLVCAPRFARAREAYAPVFTQLIHLMVRHMQFPEGSRAATALAEGLFDDMEAEDLFKDLRYEMGDVLKDCCAVVDGLAIVGAMVAGSMEEAARAARAAGAAGAAAEGSSWQGLEAALFALRAIALTVPPTTPHVLPELLSSLALLLAHFKIRYAATLVIGRYSQWTARHPEHLPPQLTYIVDGLRHPHADVRAAAAHALMYLCQDAAPLMAPHIEQLHALYAACGGSLERAAMDEVTEGVAHVVAVMEAPRMAAVGGVFIAPAVEAVAAGGAVAAGSDAALAPLLRAMATLAVFFTALRPHGADYDAFAATAVAHPGAALFASVWPHVAALLAAPAASDLRVAELVAKLLKAALVNYNLMLSDILPEILQALGVGFATTHYGCYLWASGVAVRELADDGYDDTTLRADERMKQLVFDFAAAQTRAFYAHLQAVAAPLEIGDVIDDFYRMLIDLLMFFPFRLLGGEMLPEALAASVYALGLTSGAVVRVLHFLIDVVAWGGAAPPLSMYAAVPEGVRPAVEAAVERHGAAIFTAVLSGLCGGFPPDAESDAMELVVKMFGLEGVRTRGVDAWVDAALAALGGVSPDERNRLASALAVAIAAKNSRAMRAAIKDFVRWFKAYSRRMPATA